MPQIAIEDVVFGGPQIVTEDVVFKGNISVEGTITTCHSKILVETQVVKGPEISEMESLRDDIARLNDHIARLEERWTRLYRILLNQDDEAV